jgi:hypothetical protein
MKVASTLSLSPTNKLWLYILIWMVVFLGMAHGGPLAYGICQTGCNAVVVACYAAAGFTFGTVTAGAATPAVLLACNAALGTCMAACIAAGFSPTP